jgi:hypothetical protein
MERKEEFGVKFWGVGGREVQAPIASFWFGGSVGRRVRREVEGSMGCLWTYCEALAACTSRGRWLEHYNVRVVWEG